MTFTISFGFWMMPTAITICGLLHLGLRRPTDQWDFGGAVIAAIWGVSAFTAWMMWGLTWLM
jgi:hypothetical protein